MSPAKRHLPAIAVVATVVVVVAIAVVMYALRTSGSPAKQLLPWTTLTSETTTTSSVPLPESSTTTTTSPDSAPSTTTEVPTTSVEPTTTTVPPSPVSIDSLHGKWVTHDVSLLIWPSNTGQLVWDAGLCSQDDVAICEGHAEIVFTPSARAGVWTGTYRVVTYIDMETKEPIDRYAGNLGLIAGDTFEVWRQDAGTLVTSGKSNASLDTDGPGSPYLCRDGQPNPDLCGA